MARLAPQLEEAKTLVQPSGVLSIVDETNAKEKGDTVYQYLIGQCDYGVRRFGWRNLPDRISRLDRDLLTVKDYIGSERVHVLRYDVHANGSAQFTVLAASVAFSGTHVRGQEPACARDKMKAGWFSTSDITSAASPVIVDIEVLIGEERFKVNAAASPLAEPFGDRLNPAGTAAALEAMDKAHARLAFEIVRRMPKPVAAPSADSVANVAQVASGL
jgi:hypothetical protein